jgi:hypothetical protein
MSIFGFALVALGFLTAWAGFRRILVTDLLRSLLSSGVAPKVGTVTPPASTPKGP